MIRNVLTSVGLLTLAGLLYVYLQYGDVFKQIISLQQEFAVLEQFHPRAQEIYTKLWQKLKTTGNSAEATVVKYPLAAGLTAEDAETTIKSVAHEHNIRAVSENAVSQTVEQATGQPQPFLKIFQFCSPLTAMKMVAYNNAYSAYLPCRIALVEDSTGQFNIYSLNMDMMLEGGTPLPPDLYNEAAGVWATMLEIMERGATGDF